MDIPLRAIGTNRRVFPATTIPQMGFGETEVTRRVGEAVITEVVPRLFRLSCECVVSSHDEVGSICQACRQELEAFMSEAPTEQGLSPEQLDWAATTCRRHHFTCEYPFCAANGCHRHIAVAPDGRRYCRLHYDEIVHEMQLDEVALRHGIVAAKSVGFFQSLFFDR
ncbi:MAG: hypothetical protein IT445_06215 [Phycisphaeraceae bacterium]|nr:hypothetical protein [Phycisphaeraceae bacterium]